MGRRSVWRTSHSLSGLEAVEETLQKLQHVTTSIEMSLRSVLAEKGISLRGLLLLQILIARGGPATATELANAMMVTNGAITVFVNRLEEEGLVTRTRMPIDRRIVLVEATVKAKARFEKLRSVAVEELGDKFNGWNTDDLQKLQNLLDRLMIRDK